MDRDKFNKLIDETILTLTSKLSYLTTEMTNSEKVNSNLDVINKLFLTINDLISLKEKI